MLCVTLVIVASVVVVMMIWRKRSKKDPVLPNVIIEVRVSVWQGRHQLFV